MFQTFVDKVKRFFNRSWSIFLARLEWFSGLALGILGAVDWSGFANLEVTSISHTQMLWMSAFFIIKGAVSELGRRAGTVTTVTDQLVPVNIAKKAKVEIKK